MTTCSLHLKTSSPPVESQAKTLGGRRMVPCAKVSLGCVLVAAILCACLFHRDTVSPSLPKAFIQLFGSGVKDDDAMHEVELAEARPFSYVMFELEIGVIPPQLVTNPMVEEAGDTRMPSSALIPFFEVLLNPMKCKKGCPRLLRNHLEVHGCLWPLFDLYLEPT